MRRIDLFFNYKYSFRFLLAAGNIKLLNSFALPKVSKIVCFFNLNELSDLNDVRIYNYCYFFKFFFGVKAFLTRFKDISTFRNTAYTFNVQVILRKNDMYRALYFFCNDVLSLMSKRGLWISLSYISNNYILLYSIQKLNVFLLKKANLALLNLNDPLNFKIYLISQDFFSCKQFFYFLKM